ncbi:MAG TPA: alpha/beta hydrolase [Kofleriaceae bacterium]|nr:alpha/beta hydrolase [Kofleriaceae bacterium]
MKEFRFEATGASLFATESGSGTPVIFIHGGLANQQSVRLWASAIPARLITPDVRGSGRSHDPGPLSWDQLADDVAALAAHLGIARAILGGISFGSGVAVATALRHPRLVDQLVVVHPAYGGAELGLLPAQAEAMAAMDALGSRTVTEGMAALFPLIERMPPALHERARAVFATYDPASVAATTKFMASGAQPFARGADLATITAPVLLIPGVDPTHPPEVAQVYRTHLPACTVRETPDFAAAIAALL